MEDDHEHKDMTTTPAAATKTASTVIAGARPSTADRRVERIEEYLGQSLEKKDPLQATLGAAAADLLFIRYRVAESIKAAMGDGPITLEELREDFAPAISSLALVATGRSSATASWATS